MSDLVSFLRVRLDEDESIAKAALDSERPGLTWQWVNPDTDEAIDVTARAFTDEFLRGGGEVSLRTVDQFPSGSVGPLPGFVLNNAYEVRPGVALHIARWDPARVLAEVEAKRRILGIDDSDRVMEPAGWQALDEVFRHLAQAYAGHPDFDPAWAR